MLRSGPCLRFLLACSIFAAALGSMRIAAAEQKVALVIGNSAYPSSPLRNPVNDANAMADKLQSLGFNVILRTNVNLRDMTRAFSQFGQKLVPGSVSLFYYAGHGVQVQGKNYLIPVDAEIETEASVRTEAVDVDQLLHQLGPARLSMVILDACRNNPFERRFRGAGGGLAQIDAPTGTLLAYATAPGKVAADGTGVNGLYTTELLKAINTPGLKIEDVFKQVRINVLKSSDNLQIPWESSSLTGEFFFRPGTRAEVESAQLRQSEKERAELLKEMEKLRTEMLKLKDASAQVALASPPAAAAYQVEWAQRIALLGKSRGQLTFSKALAILLGIDTGKELTLLLAREGEIKNFPWNSAYAMGTDSRGNLIMGGGYRWDRQSHAFETAVEQCAGSGGTSCKVVILNGDFKEKEFREMAAQLEKQPVSIIRRQFLEDLSAPLPTPGPMSAGRGANLNAFGFASSRK